MNPSICQAIKEQKVLRLFYGGGWRLVEPHCYGVGRNGQELLRAYQIAGHSQSGQSEGWKLFRAAQISQVEVSEEGFPGPRPDYNPNDKVMTTIYCRL